jgi:ParB-like chromosome segregation protein Spo0J
MKTSIDTQVPTCAATPSSKECQLGIEHIQLDPRLQSRELKETTVKKYADAMRRGETFPPVTVVRDGKDRYYLVDGHHRLAAVRQLRGIDRIAAKIFNGTYTDALWLSWGANRDHGLPRTHKEKRAAIIAALQHPTWNKKSDRKIAQHIGCDHKTVGGIRRRLVGKFPTKDQKNQQAELKLPSKRKVLQACNFLSKIQPQQKAAFDGTERSMVREACEALHRLLYGPNTHAFSARQHAHQEKLRSGRRTNSNKAARAGGVK